MTVKLRAVSRRVWRVGYAPNPWHWADWRWAGPEGRFQGRWDALDGGLYRTLYAGDSLFACLVELLAPLRPDPILLEGLARNFTPPGPTTQEVPFARRGRDQSRATPKCCTSESRRGQS